MNQIDRAKRTVVAVCLCLCLGFVAAMQSRRPVINKVWVGIAYVAATHGGLSAKQAAIVGLAGVWDAAVVGAAFGSIAGPAGSIVAGAAVGV